MVDVKFDFPCDTKVKIMLSIYEAHILKSILVRDKINGTFKQDLLYYLNRHLKQWKEDKERKNKVKKNA